MRTALVALLSFTCVVVLVPPAIARADVASIARTCPPGTGSACHNAGRPVCSIVGYCVSGACPAGGTCERRSVCFSGVQCGGIPDSGVPPDGDVIFSGDVAATCSPGTTCGGSTHCIDEDVCVESSSGGCAVSPESGVVGGVTLLIALTALVLLRRARR